MLAHARSRELRHLRRSRTVRGALRRMWLAGRLDRGSYDAARHVVWRAQRAAARLPGRRGAEMAAAVRAVTGLAAQRALTSSRLPLALLTLARNVEQWTSRPIPVPGLRLTYDRDPVVFRWVPGQGMQVHWLSTAGRVNGVAHACVAKPARCPRRRLIVGLSRLRALASRRDGYTAWESLYAVGPGRAPWISAMTQATAVQALARGARVLRSATDARAARSALGAFERPAPGGVRTRLSSGRAGYAMYSFQPREQILNGMLQAITGLHDAAVLTGSHRARALFATGDRGVRSVLASYDTGAWSLYQTGPGAHEDDLSYHELTVSFLRNLCLRTRRTAYCAMQRRFLADERRPPRLGAVRLHRLRARRRVTIGWALSKISDVRVTLAGPSGAATLVAGRRARGAYRMAWTPAAPGRYRLRIAATGLSGPHAVLTRTYLVHGVRRHRRGYHGATHTAKQHREKGPATTWQSKRRSSSRARSPKPSPT